MAVRPGIVVPDVKWASARVPILRPVAWLHRPMESAAALLDIPVKARPTATVVPRGAGGKNSVYRGEESSLTLTPADVPRTTVRSAAILLPEPVQV